MTRISRSHPRYASLKVRARLADAARAGTVVPEGLIAQGRGEAFDYLLGERTTPSARAAARHAALWLVNASRPVVSVNGNVAVLAAPQLRALARAIPGLRVEVNLFHRTPGRARRIARLLRGAGISRVFGVRPTSKIPGLASDRARVDPEGIARADVCLIPLEDGDRAEALRRFGIRVISVDLNPLSRTSQVADLAIVDELTRALSEIARAAADWRARPRRPRGFPPWSRRRSLAEALRTMERGLRRGAARRSPAPGRAAGRRPGGTGRPTRRTP